ncbi:MAG: Flagellar hook-associated protein 3 [Pseudomonadota bacterium]|jgi:flagellar hook-associated protein 3 FlgL
MKISTSQFFDRASQQMVQTQNRLSDMQVALSTGKKVNKPSDAPESAALLRRLEHNILQQDTYRKNLDTLNQRLQTQDATLRSASSMMIRLRELSVQYANGTLSADQRRIASIEVRGIREQLLSLANTKDANGFALFGGARVSVDAFDQNGRYQGDQTSNSVEVGDSRVVSNRRTGDHVFDSVIRSKEDSAEESVGFFKVIDDLAHALDLNEVQDVQRSIDELGQLHQSLLRSQADVGSDLNLVDNQVSVVEEQILRLKGVQSQLEDVDYAEAVTRMQKEMLGLQAAQSSFAQLSKMSLFSYLN